MAVPKRKTTPSRRGMRRAHDALKQVNVAIDPTTGEHVLRHQMNRADGTYRGREVVAPKASDDTVDETAPETL
jgi:large subunit ribosomal protein L32